MRQQPKTAAPSQSHRQRTTGTAQGTRRDSCMHTHPSCAWFKYHCVEATLSMLGDAHNASNAGAPGARCAWGRQRVVWHEAAAAGAWVEAAAAGTRAWNTRDRGRATPTGAALGAERRARLGHRECSHRRVAMRDAGQVRRHAKHDGAVGFQSRGRLDVRDCWRARCREGCVEDGL